MKQRLAGFQKPLRVKTKPVGLAVISYEGEAAVCSCGWLVRAHRNKVREDAVDRHLDRKHQSRGIRL